MKKRHVVATSLAILATVVGGVAVRHKTHPSMNINQINDHISKVAAPMPSGCQTHNGLPDKTCTPGVVNPDVTDATMKDNICNPSWRTGTIRPPVSYTTPLKLQQMKEYGYTDTDPSHFEEDHLVSLTDGGNPTDPKNLWPEPEHVMVGGEDLGFHTKDTVEVQVHKQICSGQITLEQGRNALANDWVACYHKILNHQVCL